MKFNFQLLLLLCITGISAYAQDNQSSTLNIGEPAPPLQVQVWLKGAPIQQFEKGKVYVIDFWATWCGPCIAGMPQLSAIASKYKDKATIVGIDIKERKATSIERIKAFVDSLGDRMSYHVAVEDSNFMETGWIDAFGEQRNGIPRTFVVNTEGKMAWIGHPKDLDKVLDKIVNHKWNMQKALTKRNLNKYLKGQDIKMGYKLNAFTGDPHKRGDLGKPDSALLLINETVKMESKLKYAPFIAYHTFCSLLKTNPHKAYEFGKEMLITPTYTDPDYNGIISAVRWYSNKLNLPKEIYQLGAEAHQAQIDHFPYPELLVDDIPNYYHEMAAWYWRAGNKSKAIEAERKAIEKLKNRKGDTGKDLTAFEQRLQQYQKM